MPDERDIKRQVLLRILGSPIVLGPFVAGMTALTVGWAMGLRSGVALFAGVAGLLVSAGAFVTRLVWRGGAVAQDVTDGLARQEDEARQKALDELDRQLTEADKDPRPETALRDLRALTKAFEEAEATAASVHLPTVIEIRCRVGDLFEQCVHSLTQTGRLWEIARSLRTPAAREPLLAQREKLIADVQGTVKQLSETLVGLQTLGAGEGSSSDLARLREELDRSLSVAKTVEERVASLLNGTPVPGREAGMLTNPATKG